MEELKTLQTRAVLSYNSGNLEQAAAAFEEVLQVQLMLLPENHPDVMKTQKSITLVQKKLQQAAENNTK